MKHTVHLEAEVVICVTEIVAEAGARLMILNGACIGVYEAPVLESRAEQPIDHQSRITDRLLIDIVAKSVRPINAKEVSDAPGYSPDQRKERAYAGRRLRDLASAGALKATARLGPGKKFQKYSVAHVNGL